MAIKYQHEELKQIGKDLIGLADALRDAEKSEMNDLSLSLEEIKNRLNEINF